MDYINLSILYYNYIPWKFLLSSKVNNYLNKFININYYITNYYYSY